MKMLSGGLVKPERKTILKGEVEISREILEFFRNNVGKYPAETGGMLASSRDVHVIDLAYFDEHSRNTCGSFYYDIVTMTEVYHKWRDEGYTVHGIFHSHPRGHIRPSFHDVSTALLHIRFFQRNYFYMPIIQLRRKGNYALYMYIVRHSNDMVSVTLDHVVKVTSGGFEYLEHNDWHEEYSVKMLDDYRRRINGISTDVEDTSYDEYFQKNKGLFSEKALANKVVVCVGCGGTRSLLENLARSGFRNYILMDADIVSPSNIATQGVFISEMGKKKVDVTRERIMDINPKATVITVDRFLDDDMSDDEFFNYMNQFPGREKTDYLILGCTDNFEAQARSALLALKYGAAYMAAMMYKNGAGAEIVFTYPGVTASCPRCLLRSRYEKYECGFKNDVDSSGCTVFATESMNSVKGYIALMLLNYGVEEGYPYTKSLDSVKDRNFVQIRLSHNMSEQIGVTFMDDLFKGISDYTFMHEVVWVPQVPDHPRNGFEKCKLCGGEGNLEELYMKWDDTREVRTEQ